MYFFMFFLKRDYWCVLFFKYFRGYVSVAFRRRTFCPGALSSCHAQLFLLSPSPVTFGANKLEQKKRLNLKQVTYFCRIYVLVVFLVFICESYFRILTSFLRDEFAA